jgi:hypothetical protein
MFEPPPSVHSGGPGSDRHGVVERDPALSAVEAGTGQSEGTVSVPACRRGLNPAQWGMCDPRTRSADGAEHGHDSLRWGGQLAGRVPASKRRHRKADPCSSALLMQRSDTTFIPAAIANLLGVSYGFQCEKEDNNSAFVDRRAARGRSGLSLKATWSICDNHKRGHPSHWLSRAVGSRTRNSKRHDTPLSLMGAPIHYDGLLLNYLLLKLAADAAHESPHQRSQWELVDRKRRNSCMMLQSPCPALRARGH